MCCFGNSEKWWFAFQIVCPCHENDLNSSQIHVIIGDLNVNENYNWFFAGGSHRCFVQFRIVSKKRKQFEGWNEIGNFSESKCYTHIENVINFELKRKLKRKSQIDRKWSKEATKCKVQRRNFNAEKRDNCSVILILQEFKQRAKQQQQPKWDVFRSDSVLLIVFETEQKTKSENST